MVLADIVSVLSLSVVFVGPAALEALQALLFTQRQWSPADLPSVRTQTNTSLAERCARSQESLGPTCRHVSVDPNRTTGSFPVYFCSRSTVVGPTGAEPSSISAMPVALYCHENRVCVFQLVESYNRNTHAHARTRARASARTHTPLFQDNNCNRAHSRVFGRPSASLSADNSHGSLPPVIRPARKGRNQSERERRPARNTHTHTHTHTQRESEKDLQGNRSVSTQKGR